MKILGISLSHFSSFSLLYTHTYIFSIFQKSEDFTRMGHQSCEAISWRYMSNSCPLCRWALGSPIPHFLLAGALQVLNLWSMVKHWDSRKRAWYPKQLAKKEKVPKREKQLATVACMCDGLADWPGFKGHRCKTLCSCKGHWWGHILKEHRKVFQRQGKAIKLNIKSEDQLVSLRRLNTQSEFNFAKTFWRQNGGLFSFLLRSEQEGDEGRQSAGNRWHTQC